MRYRFFSLNDDVTVNDDEIESCIEASVSKNDEVTADAMKLIKKLYNNENILCAMVTSIYERILVTRLKSDSPGYLRVTSLDENDLKAIMSNSFDNDVNNVKFAIMFTISERYGFEVIT